MFLSPVGLVGRAVVPLLSCWERDRAVVGCGLWLRGEDAVGFFVENGVGENRATAAVTDRSRDWAVFV